MVGLPASEAFIVTVWVGLIVLAAVCDVSELRIPNRISAAIAALYPAHVAATGTLANVPAAIGMAAAVFIVGALLFRLGKMGGGDVKLMTVIAFWAGPHTLSFIAVTTLAGGVLALMMTGRARFVLANTFEVLGADVARERVLGVHIPYALAIAFGASVAVAPALLGFA
jgi:prepilin peptidase CpaA